MHFRFLIEHAPSYTSKYVRTTALTPKLIWYTFVYKRSRRRSTPTAVRARPKVAQRRNHLPQTRHDGARAATSARLRSARAHHSACSLLMLPAGTVFAAWRETQFRSSCCAARERCGAPSMLPPSQRHAWRTIPTCARRRTRRFMWPSTAAEHRPRRHEDHHVAAVGTRRALRSSTWAWPACMRHPSCTRGGCVRGRTWPHLRSECGPPRWPWRSARWLAHTCGCAGSG